MGQTKGKAKAKTTGKKKKGKVKETSSVPNTGELDFSNEEGEAAETSGVASNTIAIATTATATTNPSAVNTVMSISVERPFLSTLYREVSFRDMLDTLGHETSGKEVEVQFHARTNMRTDEVQLRMHIRPTVEGLYETFGQAHDVYFVRDRLWRDKCSIYLNAVDKKRKFLMASNLEGEIIQLPNTLAGYSFGGNDSLDFSGMSFSNEHPHTSLKQMKKLGEERKEEKLYASMHNGVHGLHVTLRDGVFNHHGNTSSRLVSMLSRCILGNLSLENEAHHAFSVVSSVVLSPTFNSLDIPEQLRYVLSDARGKTPGAQDLLLDGEDGPLGSIPSVCATNALHTPEDWTYALEDEENSGKPAPIPNLAEAVMTARVWQTHDGVSPFSADATFAQQQPVPEFFTTLSTAPTTTTTTTTTTTATTTTTSTPTTTTSQPEPEMSTEEWNPDVMFTEPAPTPQQTEPFATPSTPPDVWRPAKTPQSPENLTDIYPLYTLTEDKGQLPSSPVSFIPNPTQFGAHLSARSEKVIGAGTDTLQPDPRFAQPAITTTTTTTTTTSTTSAQGGDDVGVVVNTAEQAVYIYLSPCRLLTQCNTSSKDETAAAVVASAVAAPASATTHRRWLYQNELDKENLRASAERIVLMAYEKPRVNLFEFVRVLISNFTIPLSEKLVVMDCLLFQAVSALKVAGDFGFFLAPATIHAFSVTVDTAVAGVFYDGEYTSKSTFVKYRLNRHDYYLPASPYRVVLHGLDDNLVHATPDVLADYASALINPQAEYLNTTWMATLGEDKKTNVAGSKLFFLGLDRLPARTVLSEQESGIVVHHAPKMKVTEETHGKLLDDHVITTQSPLDVYKRFVEVVPRAKVGARSKGTTDHSLDIPMEVHPANRFAFTDPEMFRIVTSDTLNWNFYGGMQPRKNMSAQLDGMPKTMCLFSVAHIAFVETVLRFAMVGNIIPRNWDLELEFSYPLFSRCIDEFLTSLTSKKLSGNEPITFKKLKENTPAVEALKAYVNNVLKKEEKTYGPLFTEKNIVMLHRAHGVADPDVRKDPRLIIPEWMFRAYVKKRPELATGMDRGVLYTNDILKLFNDEISKSPQTHLGTALGVFMSYFSAKVTTARKNALNNRHWKPIPATTLTLRVDYKGAESKSKSKSKSKSGGVTDAVKERQGKPMFFANFAAMPVFNKPPEYPLPIKNTVAVNSAFVRGVLEPIPTSVCSKGKYHHGSINRAVESLFRNVDTSVVPAYQISNYNNIVQQKQAKIAKSLGPPPSKEDNPTEVVQAYMDNLENEQNRSSNLFDVYAAYPTVEEMDNAVVKTYDCDLYSAPDVCELDTHNTSLYAGKLAPMERMDKFMKAHNLPKDFLFRRTPESAQ